MNWQGLLSYMWSTGTSRMGNTWWVAQMMVMWSWSTAARLSTSNQWDTLVSLMSLQFDTKQLGHLVSVWFICNHEITLPPLILNFSVSFRTWYYRHGFLVCWRKFDFHCRKQLFCLKILAWYNNKHVFAYLMT